MIIASTSLLIPCHVSVLLFFLECLAVKNCISRDLLVIKLYRFCTVRFCSIVKAKSVPVRSSPINHTHRNGTPTSISREHIMATHFTFCYLRVPFQLSSLSFSTGSHCCLFSSWSLKTPTHFSFKTSTPPPGGIKLPFLRVILSRVYCSVTIITGSALDLLTASFTVSLNYHQVQELTVNLQSNLCSLTDENSPHSNSNSTSHTS
jgi:hypothetical protein